MGGTEVYQPPECFAIDETADPPGAAVDAWGFGCVVFEMATSQSLPTETPFLGQLFLQDDAAKHAASLHARFANSLDTAAEAAAQDRSDSNAAKRKRDEAVRGLVGLLKGLLASSPSDRPELANISEEPWLARYRRTRLEDFFRFAAEGVSSTPGGRARSRRARMFRAKSQPKHGTPRARPRRPPLSPNRARPVRAASGGGL